MENTLIVENLVKKFGTGNDIVNAVNNVSFELKKGEFLAILGPSGSGKTTLLSMIGGLIQPTCGNIILNGLNIANISEKERSKLRREDIGFVFQHHNLIPYLSTIQNLLLTAEINQSLNKSSKENALRLLEELGLNKRINNLPSQLSGGERQRVAIGRAFMNDPTLILVDEPTASLDTERGEKIVKSIAAQIKHYEKIGIMVTHDLRMSKYVDRVLKIIDGNIQEQQPINN